MGGSTIDCMVPNKQPLLWVPEVGWCRQRNLWHSLSLKGELAIIHRAMFFEKPKSGDEAAFGFALTDTFEDQAAHFWSYLDLGRFQDKLWHSIKEGKPNLWKWQPDIAEQTWSRCFFSTSTSALQGKHKRFRLTSLSHLSSRYTKSLLGNRFTCSNKKLLVGL